MIVLLLLLVGMVPTVDVGVRLGVFLVVGVGFRLILRGSRSRLSGEGGVNLTAAVVAVAAAAPRMTAVVVENLAARNRLGGGVRRCFRMYEMNIDEWAGMKNTKWRSLLSLGLPMLMRFGSVGCE